MSNVYERSCGGPVMPRSLRCTLAVLLIGLIALTVPALATAGRPIHLGSGLASKTARFLLDHRFQDSYSNRAGGWIDCKRGGPFNAKRCRVAWAIGDAEFWGRMRIALFQRWN